ncbi:MAG TPA: hypothetical protein V6C81_24705 [Planktothrix sp.]
MSDPPHKQVSQVLGSMVLTTKSASDAQLAIDWLKQHPETSADFLVSKLLELAILTSTSPDEYVILQAKTRLGDEAKRGKFTDLLFNAVRAIPDEQIIGWGKQYAVASRSHRMVVALLESVPDNESIAMAMNSWKEWIYSPIEPDMLRAILTADPSNKKARRRAMYWMSRNRKHHCYKSISQVLN